MDVVEESLHEEPFVWAVKTSQLANYCSFCLKKQTEVRRLSRCSLCKCVYYCGAACQQADWGDHQVECKRFQAINIQLRQNTFPAELREKSAEYPDDFLRMVARLVGKLLKEENNHFSSGGRTFGALESKLVEMANAPTDAPRQAFEQFSELYAHWVGRRPKKVHKTGLLGVYGKCKTNRFVIADDAQRPIGVGIYLSLSRIAHSCAPNAVVVFRGKEAVVVPSRRTNFASPLDWKDITRSYAGIEDLATLDERRRQLADEYFLRCECVGCLEPARNGTMVAGACPDQLCVGRALPADGATTLACTKCRRVLTPAEVDKRELATKLCENIDESVRAAPALTDQLAVFLKCAKAVEGTLHKYNLHRLVAYKGCYEGCVALKRYKDAVRYGRALLDIFRHYLGEYDPRLLVFSTSLATTVANSGDADAAAQLIASLIPRSEHIYGKGSEALTYIEPSFEELIKEMNRRKK